MQAQGLVPDVVTYTAVISAHEKGGQWRRALGAYENMRARGCRPDAIVFNAIIDALWETGVIWAQRKVGQPPESSCLWPFDDLSSPDGLQPLLYLLVFMPS